MRLVLFFLGFRRQLVQDRIVGGSTSFPGEWPWAVAVVRDGVVICGGSLISKKHVLSAGHCFEK
jgi:secreted trypsin-like serine protease